MIDSSELPLLILANITPLITSKVGKIEVLFGVETTGPEMVCNPWSELSITPSSVLMASAAKWG